MPTNLHALIRFHTIDRCLRQRGRRWTREKLAEACGEAIREETSSDASDPGVRTIATDISIMRSGKLGYEAPIVWDARRRTYYYEDPDFTISRSPLSSSDLEELRHVLVILRQFRGFRQVEGVEKIVTKLELALRRDPRQQPYPIVHLDSNWLAAGLQWLNLLYDAIAGARCLQVTYHPFIMPEPYRRILSPYLLKEYNNRWFLIAYDHQEQLIRTFALDRILEAEHYLLGNFYRHPAFHPDTYFKDIIGVSLPEEGSPIEVLLRVDAAQAPYLETKPLHQSQVLQSQEEAGTVFRFFLYPNYELESAILALGERAEVLAPAALRDRIRERIAAMSKRYGQP